MDIEKLKGIFDKFADNTNLIKGKNLGNGSYGLVYEVTDKKSKKEYAGKLLIRNNSEQFNEPDLIKEFRGPNIIKFTNIFNHKYEKQDYSLILMEKAQLKELQTVVKGLINNNILNLIFKYPFEIIGDNLIRFFIKQLVEGLELLDRSSYCHFDIKPNNILICYFLTLKFSDFGLLRNPEVIKDEDEKVKIPGGTEGYLPPDYYINKNHKVSYEESIKYDYFALGATIFYIKFGKKMLNFKKFTDGLITADYIIELLQKNMDEIKSEKSFDKDFIDFLCSLIQFRAKDRPNIEEIYRNKWLNRNLEDILEVFEINKSNEMKLILELDKSDYLFEKKKYINKIRNNNNNYNNSNKINNNNNINKVNRHKFVLKL